LEERVPESAGPALRNVTDVLGVARLSGDRVQPGVGPDLSGGGEAVDGADRGEIPGGQHGTDAGYRGEKAGLGLGNQALKLAIESREAVLEVGIGAKIVLEAASVASGDGWWGQRSVAEDIKDLLGGFWPPTADMLAEQSDQAGDIERQGIVGIGAVEEQGGDALAVERIGFDDGLWGLHLGVGALKAFNLDEGAGPQAIDLGMETMSEVAPLAA